jgi:acyl-coenzyme A synthetase/AMP-(fatty) acid ligase
LSNFGVNIAWRVGRVLPIVKKIWASGRVTPGTIITKKPGDWCCLLSLGLQRGDVVSILSEDNKEWLYCDLAISASGGISNGIYTTDSAEQLAYLVNDSGSTFLFVENDEQLDKYLAVSDRMLTLKKVVVFDRKGLRGFEHPGSDVSG